MHNNFGNSLSDGVSNREKFINIMTSRDEKVVKSLGQFIAACNIS